MKNTNPATNRSQSLSIRLSPDIHNRLGDLSERFGVKPSTLISIAVGEYLTRHEQSLGAMASMQETVAQAMAKQFSDMFPEEVKEKIQEDLLQGLNDD